MSELDALSAARDAFEEVAGSVVSELALRRAIDAFNMALVRPAVELEPPVDWIELDDPGCPPTVYHSRVDLKRNIDKFGEPFLATLLMTTSKAFPPNGGIAGEMWAHAEWVVTVLARMTQRDVHIAALTEENIALKRALAAQSLEGATHAG